MGFPRCLVESGFNALHHLLFLRRERDATLARNHRLNERACRLFETRHHARSPVSPHRSAGVNLLPFLRYKQPRSDRGRPRVKAQLSIEPVEVSSDGAPREAKLLSYLLVRAPG